MTEQRYKRGKALTTCVVPEHLQKEYGLSSPDELEAICRSVESLKRGRQQSGSAGAPAIRDPKDMVGG